MKHGLNAASRCHYPKPDVSEKTILSHEQESLKYRINKYQPQLQNSALKMINKERVDRNLPALLLAEKLNLEAKKTFEHLAVRNAWRDKLMVMPNSAILTGLRKVDSTFIAFGRGCLVYYAPMVKHIIRWLEYYDVPVDAVQFWAGNGQPARSESSEAFQQPDQSYVTTSAAAARLSALRNGFLNQLICSRCKEVGIFTDFLPAIQTNSPDWICVVAVFDEVATPSSLNWVQQTVRGFLSMGNKTNAIKRSANTFEQVANSIIQSVAASFSPREIASSLSAAASSIEEISKGAWNPGKIAEALTKASQASSFLSMCVKNLPYYADSLRATANGISREFNALKRQTAFIDKRLSQLEESVRENTLLTMAEQLRSYIEQWREFSKLPTDCTTLLNIAKQANGGKDVLMTIDANSSVSVLSREEVESLSVKLKDKSNTLLKLSKSLPWYRVISSSSLRLAASRMQDLANKVDEFSKQETQLWTHLDCLQRLGTAASKSLEFSALLKKISDDLKPLPVDVIKTDDIAGGLSKQADALKTLAGQFKSNEKNVSLDSQLKALIQVRENLAELVSRSSRLNVLVSYRHPLQQDRWKSLPAWSFLRMIEAPLEESEMQKLKNYIIRCNMSHFSLSELSSMMISALEIDDKLNDECVKIDSITKELQKSNKLDEQVATASKQLKELSVFMTSLANTIEPRDGALELLEAVAAYSIEQSESIGKSTNRDLKTIAYKLMKHAILLDNWPCQLRECADMLLDDLEKYEIRIGD